MKGMRGTTASQPNMHANLVNCLLVFIYIWLASIPHTRAYPLSAADMFAENPDSQTCETIRSALDKPKKQSTISLTYFGSVADHYTQAQFKKGKLEVHEEWKKHPAHFSYASDIEQYLPQDIAGELSPELHQHLIVDGIPTNSELADELSRIYGGFQTLKKVFNYILDDHTTNKTQIIHHLNNDHKKYDSITNDFRELLRYLNLDIAELETAMTSLKIPYPEMQEVRIDHKDRTIGEWLAMREHSKLLRYTDRAYSILLQRCS